LLPNSSLLPGVTAFFFPAAFRSSFAKALTGSPFDLGAHPEETPEQ
jgi:hypothetical protein